MQTLLWIQICIEFIVVIKRLNLDQENIEYLNFYGTRRVYTRQQILDAVWGTNVYITDRTIDVHIRRLRKALSTTEECG